MYYIIYHTRTHMSYYQLLSIVQGSRRSSIVTKVNPSRSLNEYWKRAWFSAIFRGSPSCRYFDFIPLRLFDIALRHCLSRGTVNEILILDLVTLEPLQEILTRTILYGRETFRKSRTLLRCEVAFARSWI